MKTSTTSPESNLLIRSQAWESLTLEQFCAPAGEASCDFSSEHTLYLSLAQRPIRLRQTQGGKTHAGFYRKGDISITPAQIPVLARWEEADHFLQIRIAADYLKSIASESLAMNAERLELQPEFRTRDPQIEAIAMLLLAELHQENLGGRLYVESLTTALAVHLLRQYATTQPHLPIYEDGLMQRQLVQVLDYISEHLSQDIRLIDLASLLGMSQYHFSHLFKRSLGVAPYQYLLQQRIERAKQLLKRGNQSITEIAFQCGFNSHSHLSQQFRRLTGVTPSAYRAS